MVITLPDIILLGGSFNPLHIMHIRMAVEVAETLRPQKILFVPAAVPPHKSDSNLLPFADRVEMLRKALAAFPGFEVCDIEGQRSGPSYTVDTLRALQKEFPHTRLGFIMGSEDLASLPTWNEWQQLSVCADFVLPARGQTGLIDVASTVEMLWPGAQFFALHLPHEQAVRQAATLAAVPTVDKDASEEGGQMHPSLFLLPDGGRVFFLPIPRMEISSSLVRERWLVGKDIRFLVPESVQTYLQKNRGSVISRWS